MIEIAEHPRQLVRFRPAVELADGLRRHAAAPRWLGRAVGDFAQAWAQHMLEPLREGQIRQAERRGDRAGGRWAAPRPQRAQSGLDPVRELSEGGALFL